MTIEIYELIDTNLQKKFGLFQFLRNKKKRKQFIAISLCQSNQTRSSDVIDAGKIKCDRVSNIRYI